MHELPLVIFTVLAQSAAGIAIIATLGLFAGKLDEKTYHRALMVALASIAVGGVASLFHLGQPVRAINALSGIGRSPMSNEVFTTILFGASLFGTVVLGQLKKPFTSIKMLGLLTAVVGFGLILVIPTIYVLETIPQWNTSLTTVHMLLTGLIIGSAVVYMLSATRIFALCTALMLVVTISLLPAYLVHFSNAAPALLEASLLFWTMKSMFASLAITTVMLTKINHNITAFLTVIFVLLSEFGGRIGFFEMWQISM